MEHWLLFEVEICHFFTFEETVGCKKCTLEVQQLLAIKCTLKTTKLLWGHFERDHRVWSVTGTRKIYSLWAIKLLQEYMQQRYVSRVIFYLSFLATLCQEMSFRLSCSEIDMRMYYPFVTANWLACAVSTGAQPTEWCGLSACRDCTQASTYIE